MWQCQHNNCRPCNSTAVMGRCILVQTVRCVMQGADCLPATGTAGPQRTDDGDPDATTAQRSHAARKPAPQPILQRLAAASVSAATDVSQPLVYVHRVLWWVVTCRRL